MAQTESTNAPVYKLANCRSAPAPYQSGEIHTKSRVRPGKKHRKSAPRGLKTTEKTSALRGRKTTEEKNTHTTTTTDTNPTAWGERSGGRSPGFRWRPPSIQPNLEVGGQPRLITVESQETGDDDRCGARVFLFGQISSGHIQRHAARQVHFTVDESSHHNETATCPIPSDCVIQVRRDTEQRNREARKSIYDGIIGIDGIVQR